jgi:hypothetical protein
MHRKPSADLPRLSERLKIVAMPSRHRQAMPHGCHEQFRHSRIIPTNIVTILSLRTNGTISRTDMPASQDPTVERGPGQEPLIGRSHDRILAETQA